LAFPIPSAYCAKYGESEELPLELPDGTTPVLSTLRIHHPSCDPSSYQLPGGALEVLPARCMCTCNRNPNLLTQLPVKEVHLKPHQGLHFPSTELEVSYGASPQEVQTELGPPDRICHKPSSGASILVDVQSEVNSYFLFLFH